MHLVLLLDSRLMLLFPTAAMEDVVDHQQCMDQVEKTAHNAEVMEDGHQDVHQATIDSHTHQQQGQLEHAQGGNQFCQGRRENQCFFCYTNTIFALSHKTILYSSTLSNAFTIWISQEGSFVLLAKYSCIFATTNYSNSKQPKMCGEVLLSKLFHELYQALPFSTAISLCTILSLKREGFPSSTY